MIKPKRLTKAEIWNRSEDFRNKYVFPTDKIPVPIIEIAENDLLLYPIPEKYLREVCDVVGFITSDLKNIYIDQRVYEDERFENLLRFTYAHEIGHLVLHKNEIQKCKFKSPEEWMKFREDMSEDELSR